MACTVYAVTARLGMNHIRVTNASQSATMLALEESEKKKNKRLKQLIDHAIEVNEDIEAIGR